ncbi:MAG: protease pro-enzyme activation domain-containing protein, partial [Hyalangium sp.]|uniref:S53 family peptidase n=1 Tax=Hyalangium sp. TaxID=2028555 RepID=UPI00389AF6D5
VNATDLGTASPSTPVRFVVTLQRPDPAGEKAMLDAVHNPSSASFGHFLTPSAFATRFGVPSSQLDQVRSWLTGGGLVVDQVSTARDQLAVHGDVAHVDALLGTATHRFALAQSQFIANTSAPVVPLALGIRNIVGLNTLQRFSLPARTPSQDTCVGGVCTGTTTPQDMWSVYEQPAQHVGQGQKIGIFGEGRTDDVISDLRIFEAKFGLPTVPVTVVHPAGETDFSDDSGLVEWDMDTQSSTAMAPGVSELRLYFGQDLSDVSITHSFTNWVDDSTGPLQASASFGECETVPVVSPLAGQPLLNPSLPVGQGLGNNIDATFSEILRQAALEGRTLFASTGDTGSSCPVAFAAVIGAGNGVLNQVVPITNSPASLPYVVGVGGTVLYTDGAGHRSHEYGWAFSGGGSTFFIPAPSYQLGTPGLTPCVDNPLTTCRGISDVAAQSGDVVGNGFSIISGGADSVGGGTSLSSPLWVGMWARIQGASSNPQGNGFANYALYRVGNNAASYARDFFDVSSTDTATGLPASNGLYATTPGWDFVTGFGTPRVSGLICDIDHQGC